MANGNCGVKYFSALGGRAQPATLGNMSCLKAGARDSLFQAGERTRGEVEVK